MSVAIRQIVRNLQDPGVRHARSSAPCSPGLCKGSGGQEMCDTVVFVRVGENDYVSFDLEGGM
jgi:hypothetical protein